MRQIAQLRKSLPYSPIRRFTYGAILAVGSRVLAAGLAFVLGIVLAKTLGFSAYGEYAFVLAFVQLLGIVSKFGLDNTALRYVAQYQDMKQRRQLRAFVNDIARTSYLLGLAIAAVMIGVTWALQSYVSESLRTCFFVGTILLVIVPIVQVREAVLIALGRVAQGILSPVVIPGLFILLLLATSNHARLPVTAAWAMFLHVLAALVALLMATTFVSRSLDDAGMEDEDGALPGSRFEWRGMAFSMMLINVLVYIQGQSGTIFSGLFLNTDQAGLYSIASRLGGASLLGLQSINTIAGPRMASLHALGNRRELQRLAQLCIWGSLAFCLPIALTTVVYGRPLLHFFGPEFVEAYPALLVLLIGLLINASTGSVAHLLYMTGHHSTSLRLYALLAVITLILHVSLIPCFGILGAAVSTTLVQAAWNLSLVYFVRKKTGIWSILGLARIPAE